MFTMTEIGDMLSLSLLSQACGAWGLPHDDISEFLKESRQYWDSTNAQRGLHKAMLKMVWPQCEDEDSEDEGGDGRKRKRKRPASEENDRSNKTGGAMNLRCQTCRQADRSLLPDTCRQPVDSLSTVRQNNSVGREFLYWRHSTGLYYHQNESFCRGFKSVARCYYFCITNLSLFLPSLEFVAAAVAFP